MDWILSSLVLGGNFLIGKKLRLGWIILSINSLAWIYYALSLNPPQYGLIPSAAINFIICGYSVYTWSKKEGGSFQPEKPTRLPDVPPPLPPNKKVDSYKYYGGGLDD